VLFQNGNTVEWELEQVCKMWGKGKNRQQWSQADQEALAQDAKIVEKMLQ